MCGDHSHGGLGPSSTAGPESPQPAAPEVSITIRRAGGLDLRSRRAFLGQFGRNAMALAVFTPLAATACGGESTADQTAGSGTDSDSPANGTANNGADETDGSSDGDAADQTDSSSDGDGAAGEADGLVWGRANLGFVSAYVLARGNSAAIIDTGVAGSAAAIGRTLQAMGLNYGDVDHLILTHRHGDHVGSLVEIMASAENATVYAGQADLDQIDATSLDEAIVPLNGGEDVFGLQMVATPGHTAGHMAVLDASTGLLVAGDALFTDGGKVVEGPERFFDDVDQSRQTIRDLADLSYNTLLVGHGDPIESGASAAVAELAASLS